MPFGVGHFSNVIEVDLKATEIDHEVVNDKSEDSTFDQEVVNDQSEDNTIDHEITDDLHLEV